MTILTSAGRNALRSDPRGRGTTHAIHLRTTMSRELMLKSTTERLMEILVEHDPVRIYSPDHTNEDEYEPEAKAIAAGLHGCATRAECLDLVYSTFVRFFGAGIAGDPDRYVPIAADVWAVCQRAI